METTPQIEKITIIFPPGDQLTSLLISKEANTKIEDLLNRLCALRAIELDLKKLAVVDDVGKEVDMSKTVGESGLVFIDIVDRKEEKEKKKKEQFTYRGLPKGVTVTLGECCYIPLEDQLFDDEKKSLFEFKQKNESLCKNFSDEFIVACLLARKLDQDRALELLQSSFKWRKDNNFLVIPKFSEIDKELFDGEFQILGARDKHGRCIRYVNLGWQPNVPPHTIDKMKQFYGWLYFVGIFSEGIDAIRNGVHGVVEMGTLTWKQFDLDFQKQLGPLWANTFPVLIRRSSLINSPVYLGAIMKIMRTIVKAKVIDRMRTVKTQKSLLKQIEKNQLWKERGGDVDWTPKMTVALMQEWSEKNEERLSVKISE